MKALSLTQPWATLVAIGVKRLETRSWSTSYRGWLAIHAAKTFSQWARDICLKEPYCSALAAGGDNGLIDLPLGAIIAVGNLHRVGIIGRQADGAVRVQGLELPVEGIELSFGDYTPGRYAWVFTNVRRLHQPVPFKGALGLWQVPDDLLPGES